MEKDFKIINKGEGPVSNQPRTDLTKGKFMEIETDSQGLKKAKEEDAEEG